MALKDYLRSIRDSYSVRAQPREVGYAPDAVTEQTRTRVLLVIRDLFSGKRAHVGAQPGNHTAAFWENMHNRLEHLYGRVQLSKLQRPESAMQDAVAFVLNCEAKEFFDFLEQIFKGDVLWRVLHEENDLVDAINDIFRSERAPYQLTPMVKREEQDTVTHPGGYSRIGTVIKTVALPRVIRVDDEVTHTEAVLPALSVVADPAYAGANDEFRRALDDYRQGDFEDCVGKCGSAFESVLKVLCQKNGIPFDPYKDTAGPLLDKVLARSALDTATFTEPLIAVTRMRNRLSSSHGGGSTVKIVQRHVAQFALTSTAAAIVLLVHDMGK